MFGKGVLRLSVTTPPGGFVFWFRILRYLACVMSLVSNGLEVFVTLSKYLF